MSLWQKNKDQFRAKYYLNAPSIETPETIFGKKIAKMVEDNKHLDHKVLSNIINYPIKEHKLEVELEGIKLLGYLDQFDPDALSIGEMKTGHLSSKGKVPWDKLKVQKHKQLDFYTVLVELKYGKFNPVVVLQWLETKFYKDTMEFDGHILEAGGRKLELTGRIETFKRTIKKWEVEKMKQDIIRVANEINEDYKLWKTKI